MDNNAHCSYKTMHCDEIQVKIGIISTAIIIVNIFSQYLGPHSYGNKNSLEANKNVFDYLSLSHI